MMIYEKAIEKYAKVRREFHESELKKEIANYNRRIEEMTATGECGVIYCEICPLWLFSDYRDYRSCDKLTKEQIRELIAMEVKK